MPPGGPGDPQYVGVQNGRVIYTVGSGASHYEAQSTTRTVVTANFDPTQYGYPVTFTATVAPVDPAAPTPTGSVQFSLDGSPVGGAVALVGGMATWTTSSLAIGTHTVSADYTPDSISFVASTSPLLSHTVKKRLATTTAVTSDIHPSVFGQSVTYTATITPENLSSGLPITGHVQFFVDGVATGGPQPISAGQASIAFNDLKAGSRGIRAQYLGDANYTGSTSPTYTQLVKKATPSGSVTSLPPSPITFGAEAHLHRDLRQPGGSPSARWLPPPSSSSSTARPWVPPWRSAPPRPAVLATFTPTWSLPAGTHTIKAKYLGNGNFLAVLSAGYTLKINP